MLRRPARAARWLAVAVALAAPAACTDAGSDDPTTPPSASTASPAPSPTTSPSPSVSPSPSPSPSSPPVVRLPDGMAAVVDAPEDVTRIAAGDLIALVPPGATIGSRQVLLASRAGVDQIAVTWDRGDDPFAAEHGFVVWQQLEDRAWHALYAFTDPVRKGVLGIQPLRAAELTGDGLDEIMTFEDTGGSGACGIARVISPAPGAVTEIFRRSACDTGYTLREGALEIREAVFEPDDPHCCPSAFRTTTFEWDGSELVETDVVEEPT